MRDWLALAFALFLLDAGLTAPSVGWLDGGELVASAWDLGVSHPPGQPLPSLLWRLAMLAPVSSIAHRATLVSCVCVVAACLPLALLLRMLTGPLQRSVERAAPWLVGAPVLLGVAVWTQAVRAEVYAIQLLLALGVVAASVACHRGEPAERFRASLAVGGLLALSGATHPLLAIALVPAALVGLVGALRESRPRRVVSLALFAAGAASTLAYLPLRSAARPAFAWGMPHTPEGLVAVLSGRAFAQNFSPSDAGNLAHNLGVVARVVWADSGPGLLLLAVVGAVMLLRRGQLAALVVVGLAVLGNVATVLFQNKVFASNPDLHGYLCLTTASTAVLAGVALIAGLGRLVRSSRAGGVLLWGTAAVMVVAQLPAGRAVDRASNWQPELAARAQGDGLAPGAVLVTSGNSAAFVGWYLERIERRRPDLVVFHRTLLGHPFYERRLRERFGTPPAGVDTGRLRTTAEEALHASRGPVALEIREPDLGLAPRLVPAGRVMHLHRSAVDAETQLPAHDRMLRRWDPEDRGAFTRDAEARTLLLYERLLRASYYRERGLEERLDAEWTAARRLAPHEELILPEPVDVTWWRTW